MPHIIEHENEKIKNRRHLQFTFPSEVMEALGTCFSKKNSKNSCDSVFTSTQSKSPITRHKKLRNKVFKYLKK